MDSFAPSIPSRVRELVTALQRSAHLRTQIQNNAILSFFRKIQIISGCSNEKKLQILKHIKYKQYAASTTIYSQGKCITRFK